MEYTNKHGYDFSKLTLGTVQLGMHYGISNVHGKPSSGVAGEIIEAAMTEGITALDTSITYGSAEAEIGRYFTNSNHDAKPIVITKFKIGARSSYDQKDVRDEIFRSIESSMRSLGLTKIPVYLLHQDKNQNLERLVQPLSNVLQEIRERGLVDIVGISSYGPEDVDIVLDHDIFGAVQIPINILDQRLMKSDKLRHLQEQDKIVFARSVFLQGLFFMDRNEIPEKLQDAKPYLKRLDEIARSAGLTVPQLSFSYVKNIPAVTSIVFGAVTREQVNQNVELMKTPELNKSVTESIREAFSAVPEHIITPGLWG